MTSEQRTEAMQTMRAQGFSDAAIGLKFGFSRQRVNKLLGRTEISRKTIRTNLKADSSFLATALITWRAEFGLSQTTAAHILHVAHYHTLSNWERDINKPELEGLILNFIALWKKHRHVLGEHLPHATYTQILQHQLYHWRTRHGLTQAEAAKIFHLAHVGSYSKWERGLPCTMPGLVIDFIKLWNAENNIPKMLIDTIGS